MTSRRNGSVDVSPAMSREELKRLADLQREERRRQRELRETSVNSQQQSQDESQCRTDGPQQEQEVTVRYVILLFV